MYGMITKSENTYPTYGFSSSFKFHGNSFPYQLIYFLKPLNQINEFSLSVISK